MRFTQYRRAQKPLAYEQELMTPRVSAGGVVVGRDGRIILVRQHSNSWSLPKGGVEGGETLLEAAVREIFEETGIANLTFVAVLGEYERYSIGKDGVGENRELPIGKRTIFLFTTNEEAFNPTDAEITDIRWASIEEAIELLTHPTDAAFLASVSARIQGRPR